MQQRTIWKPLRPIRPGGSDPHMSAGPALPASKPMRNLIKLNRDWRRKRHQLSELEAVRTEALASISRALTGLSERLAEIGLEPLSTRQIVDAAAAMRTVVLDATDAAETGLAIDHQRLELEIEKECWDRGLHEGITLNSLQNAEHMRDRVRAAIRDGRELVKMGLQQPARVAGGVAFYWQHYRRHMREAFKPVDRPLFVQNSKPRPLPVAAE